MRRVEENSEPTKVHSDMQEPNVRELAHREVRHLLAELKHKRKAHTGQKQRQAIQEEYRNIAWIYRSEGRKAKTQMSWNL